MIPKTFDRISVYIEANSPAGMEIYMHNVPEEPDSKQQYEVWITPDLGDCTIGCSYNDCAEYIAEQVFRNHEYEFYVMFCRVVGLQVTHGQDDYADGIPASEEDDYDGFVY